MRRRVSNQTRDVSIVRVRQRVVGPLGLTNPPAVRGKAVSDAVVEDRR